MGDWKVFSSGRSLAAWIGLGGCDWADRCQRETEIKGERFAVEEAVDAVIGAEVNVERLVEEAEELTSKLAQRRHLLAHLAAYWGHWLIADPALRERAAAVARADLDADARTEPAAAAWRALRERLAADADAPVEL